MSQGSGNTNFQYAGNGGNTGTGATIQVVVVGNNPVNLSATTNQEEALANSNFVIIATPTNFDEPSNVFDTTSVEDSIQVSLKLSDPKSLIVIKSTIKI